jgi:alpha/beta superfamily hydrolase
MQKTSLIPGKVGQIEAIWTEPQDRHPVAVAIICHPHPQHQGTMNNKVVTTLMKAFDVCGAATLRFNFRGVGQSEGEFDNAVGECDDLRAMIAWVKEQYPQLPIWLGGFSFGAYVAARVASDDQVAKKLVTVAPAVDHYSFSDVAHVSCPWLVVHGDQDDVATFKTVESWAANPPSPLEFIVVKDAGHFFHGCLIELREIIVKWLES